MTGRVAYLEAQVASIGTTLNRHLDTCREDTKQNLIRHDEHNELLRQNAKDCAAQVERVRAELATVMNDQTGKIFGLIWKFVSSAIALQTAIILALIGFLHGKVL